MDFEKYTANAEKYYKNKPKVFEHVKKVAEISELICCIADFDDEDRQIVKLGALLHDIGKGGSDEYKNFLKEHSCSKKDAKEHHNEFGAQFLEEKFFDGKDKNPFLVQLVVGIVRYHKGKLEDIPDLRGRQLISVVRFSDKISKVYKIKDDVVDCDDKIDKCVSELTEWLDNSNDE